MKASTTSSDLTPTYKGLDARALLKIELQKRLASRPRYSLRAFARNLKVSPATLSLILSGKLEVSENVLKKIVDNLDLSEEQVEFLWTKQESNQNKVVDRHDIQEVTWDIFSVFSEWYHFAILSLLELNDSSLQPRWLAGKLGITISEASLAVERLKKLGLLTEVNGKWKQTGGHIRVPSNLSTAASRKFQKQLLEKAILSLENDAQETRDVTSMTFAMDPNLVEYASIKITEFRRALVRDLEKKKKSKSVYTLTIQLFPLTKE